AQNRSLLAIGTEQDADRTFACGLIATPIRGQRRTPRCHGAKEAILTGAPSRQDQNPAGWSIWQFGAAGALSIEFDFELLGERYAVDQLGQYAPGPETLGGEHPTKQSFVGHGIG